MLSRLYPGLRQGGMEPGGGLADPCSPTCWRPNRSCTQQLDEEFFHVRFEKATDREREYMAAMADLGEGPTALPKSPSASDAASPTRPRNATRSSRRASSTVQTAARWTSRCPSSRRSCATATRWERPDAPHARPAREQRLPRERFPARDSRVPHSRSGPASPLPPGSGSGGRGLRRVRAVGCASSVHRGLSWRALGVHTGCKTAANPPKPKDLSRIKPVSPIAICQQHGSWPSNASTRKPCPVKADLLLHAITGSRDPASHGRRAQPQSEMLVCAVDSTPRSERSSGPFLAYWLLWPQRTNMRS